MKKMAILLIGLILFAVPFFPSVKSAQKPDYAKLTLVKLGLKDSIIFGNYEIKFADVNPDWTQALIEIYKKGESKPSKTALLTSGGRMFYPDSTNPILEVSIGYIMSYNKVIYLEAGSPLKKAESKTLDEGKTYKPTYLDGKVSIKLVDVTDSSAKFTVTLNGISYTKTIEEDSGQGFGYKISSDISYYPFVWIKVTKAVKNDYAEFDIWIPTYPVTSVSVKRASQTGTQNQTQGAPDTVVYNDVMYKDEILNIYYNGTTYKLRLNQVGLYSSFSLFKGTTPLETFQVKAGGYHESDKAPIGVEVVKDSYDTEYNRLTVKVWAPHGASAPPILREAKLKLIVETTSKKIMLGDKMILTVKVVNEGKGKAFGLKLNSNIPNGLEQEVYPEKLTITKLDAFSEYPLATYILTPSQVGSYQIGKFGVEYYDEFGNLKKVESDTIGALKVYTLPKIELNVDNDYFKVDTSKDNKVKVKFNVVLEKGNPAFEFIENATLHLEFPDSLNAYSRDISLGDLRANESISKEIIFTVNKAELSKVSATLTYKDALGEEHQIEFPNLVIIDAVPPAIVEKKVKVYPEAQELPSFVNATLAGLDNETRALLAEELKNVSEAYIPPQPPKTNWWAVFAILFLIFGIGFGVAYYNLKGKYEEAQRKLARRKPKPGGLPLKKEEEVKEELEDKGIETL
ncbi:DNA cytosine methyltransferase [Thermococci archaeon]|nr:MAG: DNA cytosine methyltransferase [Thermococci archaeon]